MKRVYVSLGSNIEPDYYLCKCLSHLRARFGAVDCSTVYRTQAVGFVGDDFLNLVVSFTTHLPSNELIAILKQLELILGRKRGTETFIARTLDADLLLYEGENIIHHDIERYPFVLYPLLELAPSLILPTRQQPLSLLAQTLQLSREGMVEYKLNCSLTKV